MSVLRTLILCALLSPVAAVYAQSDVEGCKDHPSFNRLPNFHIADCESSQAEQKHFPMGPVTKTKKEPALESVQGPYMRIHYVLNDGAVKPGADKMMRDFATAAKLGGGSVMGEYPGACNSTFSSPPVPGGDSCINHGVTMKSAVGGKEVWAFMQSTKEAVGKTGYELRVVEREAGKPNPVANEMLEKIIKEGYVTLYINFDIGKASIKSESVPTIVQIVEMLKLAPDMNLEVGGHTDNVGGEKSNQTLSEARAQHVVKTLIESGVPAARLTAKGYGQSKPIADNKTNAGREANRRVELRKI